MAETDIQLDIRSYGDESKTHHHDHHQLVLPLAGRLTLSIDHVEGEVEHQKAAIIPAGRDHGFSAPESNRFLVADVPEGLAPSLEKLPFFVDLDPVLVQYVEFLHGQLAQGGSSPGTERQMLLLLIQLLQERFGSKLNLDRRVAAAKRYLDDNFGRKVTMADLAAVAHLGIRQLNDLFKSQVGMTPHHYLTEIRMQHAWHLLEHSDMAIQQIADQAGYSSLASFSDRFTRHFGKPPSYFRRAGK